MSDANQYVTRLNALTRAINVNPKNREIYGKLVKFIASDAGDQFNMEWFEEARVDSPDPGVLATMLGLRAILDGKEETARTHWRVSQQLYTLSELVLNHLIVVGSREELAEFSQPTELLTESLKSFPGSPVLLQSRGFFYTKDPETYQLAVSDFENALEKLPNLLEARKFLVLLHNELGNTAEADRNERRLEDALKVVSEDQLEKLTERLSRLTL